MLGIQALSNSLLYHSWGVTLTLRVQDGSPPHPILASYKGRERHVPYLYWPQLGVTIIALILLCPRISHVATAFPYLLKQRYSSYFHLFVFIYLFAVINSVILACLYIGPIYLHCYFYRIDAQKWNYYKGAF